MHPCPERRLSIPSAHGAYSASERHRARPRTRPLPNPPRNAKRPRSDPRALTLASEASLVRVKHQQVQAYASQQHIDDEEAIDHG